MTRPSDSWLEYQKDHFLTVSFYLSAIGLIRWFSLSWFVLSWQRWPAWVSSSSCPFCLHHSAFFCIPHPTLACAKQRAGECKMIIGGSQAEGRCVHTSSHRTKHRQKMGCGRWDAFAEMWHFITLEKRAGFSFFPTLKFLFLLTQPWGTFGHCHVDVVKCFSCSGNRINATQTVGCNQNLHANLTCWRAFGWKPDDDS